MATMIKEKRKDKRKSKEKHSTKTYAQSDTFIREENVSTSTEIEFPGLQKVAEEIQKFDTKTGKDKKDEGEEKSKEIQEESEVFLPEEPKDSTISVSTELNLQVDTAFVQEQLMPSAPIFHEPDNESSNLDNHVVKEVGIPKLLCMPLEEAIRIFGGREIAEVRALSVREEAIVEAGPKNDSDNPLVDLLSTFRSSLVAVERERNRISCGYIEEEKSRATLWKVEKRKVIISEKCACGSNVTLRASYDVAELQTHRLPAARLRLESLLREVQETYCHHQHAALLAHYDIDELLSEIVNDSKDRIREALALIFQAMKLSDGAPDSFGEALQRWAGILSAALLDTQDMGHLLFLMHYLFRLLELNYGALLLALIDLSLGKDTIASRCMLRLGVISTKPVTGLNDLARLKQTRSVRWASSVVYVRVWDAGSVAGLLALLELMLTRPSLEEALECTEEGEAWEEVDEGGEGGAVGEGRLRERDLLALLEALPLGDMVARLMLFTRQDINQESEDTWRDSSGGHGVLKACCGARTLLHVFQRAAHTHTTYTRLHAHLQNVSVVVLCALAELHQHCGSRYITELEERISVELEACFAAGLVLLGDNIHRLPVTLLRQHVAKEYCAALINGLHETSPVKVSSVCVSVRSCAVRARSLALAAMQRVHDQELASTVVEFLFQTGIKPGPVRCKGGCDEACRELMPQVLSTHRDLHTAVLYMLADLEDSSPAIPPALCVGRWRPQPAALLPLLQHWERRRPARLPQLLLALHYAPHDGLCLDTQLAIGSWLCSRGEAPEWAWQVLRELRVHRSQWGLPLEAPSHEPCDLLDKAFALLAGDWGHCIPLVCGPGADALLQLARCRPLEAAHCLGPIMVVMAQSPESLALTPRFTEIFTTMLNQGGTIVRFALRRSPPGEEALRRLLTEQLRDTARGRSALLSSWLHALWAPALPAPARAMLDAAVAQCRDWPTLDRHAVALLQSENAEAYISCAVSEAASCPLLCEAVLRALLARERGAARYAALLDELARQRAAGERIHVDNALKAVGWSPAPVLCVYACGRALLRAGPQHPAHVLLARLLLHAYLQRHGTDPAPVGTLFFSGLIQSRLYLAQIKNKLREFATYHRERAASLKEHNTTATDEKTTISILKVSPKIDDSPFPTLKISDFISDAPRCEEGQENSGTEENTSEVEMTEDRDTFNLISYHTAVEQLCRQYALWLDEGDKVRASPHHADVVTLLSEQALDAAWRDYLKTTTKSSSSPTPTPPSSPSPCTEPTSQEHLTHFERAVESIRSINNGSKDKLRPAILPEPLHESYFKNDHMLYELLDNSINQLKKASDAWCAEVSRVWSLDGQLLRLVAALRVGRSLPAVRQPCPQGCGDIVVTISEEEWVVSSGAAQGIIDNRCSARSSMRALARPRPAAARAAALLQAIARRVRNPALALGACHRAWGAVPGLERYGPGADALASLVESLVTKFISRDIDTSVRLLKAWGGEGGESEEDGALRRRLCGALVGGARREHRGRLYVVVLHLPLPPHVTFSYLSKFDLHNWADTASSAERNEILETIVNAAERLGPTPEEEQSVLLEQLGVHSLAVVRDAELCPHVTRVASAAARCRLPPQLLRHLPAAVRACTQLHHDQLGHLLRGIGSSLWAARVSPEARRGAERALFCSYAPLVADALYALTDAFVDSAIRCSFTPERVSWYAWSAVVESWSAWLAPHSAPPLLPHHTTDHHNLATRFADTVVLIMHRCPGCEEYLLRHVWDWTVRTYVGIEPAWPTECRLLMVTLLAVLADLPWHLQWFRVASLPLALQACSVPDEAAVRWCSTTLQGVGVQSWLQGVEDHQLAPALDGLLALFTSRNLVLPQESYKFLPLLPWHRLPVTALDAALQRYFQEHYSPAEPYHDKPQFTALLSASLLQPPVASAPPAVGVPSVQLNPSAFEHRACAVSQWVRAACSPALASHVRAHCERVLDVLTDLAPHIEQSEGEMVELLSRAAVIMCIEPAAAVALPVWLRRVRAAPPRLRGACASAAGSLTVLEYFAPLADCAARAELEDSAGGGWSSLASRWSRCAWWAPGALLRRGAAHAGYALHRAGARGLAPAFTALLGGSVKLSENEEIVAVWICVACRVMLQARATDADEAFDGREVLADKSEAKGVENTRGPGGELAEPEEEDRGACGAAAHALVSHWAQHRRSLLQLVALQASDDCPTARLQLLCRLALFVVNPSEASYSSYTSACASVACAPYVPAASAAPEPCALPRAAVGLYPHREAYFEDELKLATHSV